MNGGGAAGIDALDRGLGDGVSVFAEVILDSVVIPTLADLIGPDGASIL